MPISPIFITSVAGLSSNTSQTITGTGSPTAASAPTTTITNFSATDGDRIDLSAILNRSSTVNSTIRISQSGASNTSMSITVGGVDYFIANLRGQEVSSPEALPSHASGTTLATALHGTGKANVVDVTSAHGAPARVPQWPL